MRKTKLGITVIAMLFGVIIVSFAQSISFPDDAIQRGYHDRPYKRYEAESGKCTTNGTILSASHDQRTLQSEASNQVATQLSVQNSYIQWTCDEAADGMVIRFSIPDGTTGVIALYAGSTKIQDIALDSKWAWQYFPSTNENDGRYAYNTPGATRFPRMRFDEVRVKLTDKIPAGSTFRLVKEHGTSIYTIDFVELEPIPAKVDAPADAAIWNGSGLLDDFINTRSGQTIYIPEGKYDLGYRVRITAGNVKIIGAGMWYTQLHFTADPGSDNFRERGIEASGSNITLDGLYLTTVNDRRYRNYGSSSEQVGKGLMGSFGNNSTIQKIWATHFECGAWIEGANNLTVTHCRFRNNYADGINLCRGSVNNRVTHCSFRNNGDDDMASWSRQSVECANNLFQYNTAENNWRASSIAFFGGRENKAFNCVIIDAMEAGIRVNSDFDGSPFSINGYFELKDISVYRSGTKAGNPGISGDLWGNRNGALFISSARTWGTQYDVRNVKFSNINIYDSKGDAVHIKSNPKYIYNVSLENIMVNTINTSTVGNGMYYGLCFDNAGGGSGNTFCVNYVNVAENNKRNTIPSGFTENTNCAIVGNFIAEASNKSIIAYGNTIEIKGVENGDVVTVYNTLGAKIYNIRTTNNPEFITTLPKGVYLVQIEGTSVVKKVLIMK